MIFMGCPIDARSPTAVNHLAEERGFAWFRRNFIRTVPLPFPARCATSIRASSSSHGFMSMNKERHINAHRDMFRTWSRRRRRGPKHEDFYDEYLSVMDLTEEIYMETVDIVFREACAAHGRQEHREKPVDLKAIRNIGADDGGRREGRHLRRRPDPGGA